MPTQLQQVAGTLPNATISGAYQPGNCQPFNIFIYGTFSATVAVVRSIDGGVTWIPLANANQSGALSTTARMSWILTEPDPSVLYAVSTQAADGGAYTSGTVSYRIG